jgi:Mg2+ and Co2+ transporter CorA
MLTALPDYRNVTFMIESAEAVISTLDAMLENLDDFDVPTADNPKKLRKSTVSAIRYRRRTFKSTLLRVCSIERRASSGTQIYQAQLAQADSHAMKSIAFLTLMFLPVTGVATIFSSPFFNVDFDKDSTPLRVAWCFWKFWAVVGPLTFGMCLLCYFWYRFPGFFSFVHAFLTKEFWARRCEETRRRQERRKQEKLGV